LTGVYRKLRDDVFGAAVSPDSSHIAFLNGARNEIWLMGPNAENPRRILAVQNDVWYSQVEWSSDARRIAYMKHRRRGSEALLEILDLASGQPTVVLSDRRLGSFCWGRDGRILYTLAESPPNETSSNLWEIQPPSGAGRSPGSPRRLTNWAGFNLFYLSLSADGKRLAFVRGREQSDVYVGELESDGARLKIPRRFTLDDRIDWPGGWSRDSKAILFFSDRNGNLDILRQGINDRIAEALVATQEEERRPSLVRTVPGCSISPGLSLSRVHRLRRGG
jgi:Tol biopolymer transport system component